MAIIKNDLAFNKRHTCTFKCKPVMLALLIVLFCVSVHAQLQVNTTEGYVEGLLAEQDYIAFYGIPYAGPVDGPNRFKIAPPPAQRSYILQANNTEIICAQPSVSGIKGIENCLTLNIFTSNLTTSSRPVLVWLNAEEYTKSSNDIPSFKNFVNEGIVVVTVNFRLSIFGFLCLRVEQAPGNAGIKDIIQGLDWINRNIEGFGGNPDNVLLMGHGSAAALVDIITMVPRANNLVHKVMTISGSVLSSWAVAYRPVEYAEAFGQVLGYDVSSHAELATQLSSTDIDLLLPALNSFTFTNNTPLFAPCIEDARVSTDELILTDSPLNILRAGSYNDIPYIAAYVTKEGTLKIEQAVNGTWLEEMQNDFSNFLPADLDFGADETDMENFIKNTYYNATLTVEDFLNYQGDTLIVFSVIRGARERAATSKSDVRLMEFGVRGLLDSDWLYPEIELDGLRHGGIQNFLFGFDLQNFAETSMRSLVSRITAFADNGVPVAPAPVMFLWAPISANDVYYVAYHGYSISGFISAGESVRRNPSSETMVYWTLLYSRYYKPLEVVNKNTSAAAGQLGALFYTVLLSFVASKFV